MYASVHVCVRMRVCMYVCVCVSARVCVCVSGCLRRRVCRALGGCGGVGTGVRVNTFATDCYAQAIVYMAMALLLGAHTAVFSKRTVPSPSDR